MADDQDQMPADIAELNDTLTRLLDSGRFGIVTVVALTMDNGKPSQPVALTRAKAEHLNRLSWAQLVCRIAVDQLERTEQELARPKIIMPPAANH